MKELILIRHCQAEGQHKDSPLTNSGVNQAHRLAEFFNQKNIKLDRVISSPYMRAVETIKPYADEHQLKITTDQRLQERIISFEPIDDWLDVLETSFIKKDFRLPGGESANDASERGLEVIHEVLNDPDHERTALITHGNLLAILLAHFDESYGFEQWRTLGNPDVFSIKYQDDSYLLEHIW
jgi:2,3-bisphosphoglycerate-dependent phosphoglycerate mutase